MKAKQLVVHQPVETSFSFRQDRVPNVNSGWHFHEEIELIYFHRGSGMQFVGDSITRFAAGDVVMVGANVPHCWKYDEDTGDQPAAPAYSTVIHFQQEFLGGPFMRLPESAGLGKLFEQCGRGLQLRGRGAARVAERMAAVGDAGGIYRLVALLQCLATLAQEQPNARLLSSVGFSYQADGMDEARINKVYSHCFSHFGQTIRLEEIADLVGLSRTSFCRFFKQRTGRTFSRFLAEVRIGHACKQLVEKPGYPIKQLCYASGYRNFTSFHETFRLITGMTPKTYRALHAAGRVGG